MRKKFRLCTLALSVLLCVSFVFSGCGLIAVNLGKPSEKEFSKAGMSIVLTDDFVEQDIISQTATYQSAKHLVAVIKEEFSILEESGLSTDMSLKEYAEILVENNKLDSVVKVKDGFTCFEYEKTLSGKDFTYLAVVQKGTDAYWFFQFASESKDFEKSEAQFIEWAKTIKFS